MVKCKIEVKYERVATLHIGGGAMIIALIITNAITLIAIVLILANKK